MRLLKLIFPACLILSMQGLILNNIRLEPAHKGNSKTIKIGLLISDNKSIEARNGAKMAISEANAKGGYKNIPFSLVVRSMEGPWGTGSKQAVDLIFDEKVIAILGSHDGRNAHLVEQVATKAGVVFLSVWSGDPTLSQAFVPWFFNCAPNYLQQADFLIKSIYRMNKQAKIALVSDESYDSESAAKNYLKISTQWGKENPIIININKNEKDMNNLFIRIKKAGVNTIVLSGGPATAYLLFKELKERNISQSVYCFLSVLGEITSEDPNVARFEGALISTSGTWYKSGESGFSHGYRLRFGMSPGAVAAYAYDGAKLITEAIKDAGTEREDIQRWLLEMQYYGVTGTISFDEKGNRESIEGLIEIKNGLPVTVER